MPVRRDTVRGDPGHSETIFGEAPDELDEQLPDGSLDAKAKARAKKRPARKPRPRRRPPVRAAGPVEIPIDVGVGPVLLLPNPGGVFDARPAHFGLALSVAAVVDKATLRKYAGRIPAEYRGMARNLDEVRVRPWYLGLIPEVLVISPQVDPALPNVGMYGAIWHPFGIGLSPIREPVRVSVDANLAAAYVLVHSSSLRGGSVTRPSFTHFLRPGVNLGVTVEVPLTDTLLLSTGWSSDLFIPQPIGGSPLEVQPLDPSLWHLGGPFLKLHVRIPYEIAQ